jgi:hypothetical protein
VDQKGKGSEQNVLVLKFRHRNKGKGTKGSSSTTTVNVELRAERKESAMAWLEKLTPYSDASTGKRRASTMIKASDVGPVSFDTADLLFDEDVDVDEGGGGGGGAGGRGETTKGVANGSGGGGSGDGSMTGVRSGYLWKRAIKSGRNWKRRFFVLAEDKLVYYKSADLATKDSANNRHKKAQVRGEGLCVCGYVRLCVCVSVCVCVRVCCYFCYCCYHHHRHYDCHYLSLSFYCISLCLSGRDPSDG